MLVFIPNNDINQARRMRINKCKEYGAVRADTWSRRVTHVIVDKKLDFKAVMTAIPSEDFSVRVGSDGRVAVMLTPK